MRILHTVSPYHPVTADSTGGVEQLVYLLDKELIKKGHSSSVIARGDSELYGNSGKRRLIPVLGNVVDTQKFSNSIYNEQFTTVVRYATELEQIQGGNYDIVHSHATDTMRFGRIIGIPIVTTLHFPVEWYWNRDLFGEFDYGNNIFVALSEAQRRIYEQKGYTIGEVIYNGIDVNSFPFSSEKEDYLLSLGRIAPEKGQDTAIEVAKSLGMDLIIAGGIGNDAEKAYFDEKIKPFVNFDLSSEQDKMASYRQLESGHKVVYVGPVNNVQKKPLYEKARAFLMPIDWEEPFGLVIVESMACGTPVVAYNRGAIPELIEDGKTGYVVESMNDMADAVKNAGRIKPEDCRQRIIERFSAERMAEDYLQLYRHLSKSK